MRDNTKISLWLVTYAVVALILYFHIAIENLLISGNVKIMWWISVNFVLLIKYIYDCLKKSKYLRCEYAFDNGHETIENIHINKIYNSTCNDIVTWNVEKSVTHTVESYYERFENIREFDKCRNELVDFDEFCIESFKFLSAFMEKRGIKTKMYITDEILPTILSDKELLFQILSAIAVECVNTISNEVEVVCNAHRNEDRIEITIYWKTLCTKRGDFKLLKADKLKKISELLNCYVLIEIAKDQIYFALII